MASSSSSSSGTSNSVESGTPCIKQEIKEEPEDDFECFVVKHAQKTYLPAKKKESPALTNPAFKLLTKPKKVVDSRTKRKQELNKIFIDAMKANDPDLNEDEKNGIIGDESYECDICLMIFCTDYTLKTHFELTHTGKRDYKCDNCGFKCETKQSYVRHRNTHFPRKQQSANDTLKQWLVAYENEYECDICFMKFDEVSILASHKLSHLPQPGYKCKFCGLRTKSKHFFKNHMQMHTENDKTFRCKLCSSTFLYKSHLTRHQIVHSSKKYYQCADCYKLFKLKSEIIRHVRIHMDIVDDE